MKSSALLVLVALAGLLGRAAAQEGVGAELETVRLQLKWQHQFQFAGFYAALEKGLYRKAGLHVEILEGHADVDFVETVISGGAEYGIEMPDLLLHRNQGDPVVVLACIYQHSPISLISRSDSGIRSPHDLIGRRIMLRPASNADLRAMIVKEGVSLDDIEMLDHSFDIEDLIDGKVDAMSLYATAYLGEMRIRGIDSRALRPDSYGIDFYGDCLFTSERELRDHPKRVEAFRAASLEGWFYAMEHPDEIAQLIHEKYAPAKSLEALRLEAEQMQPLILHRLVELGHINSGRWTHIADTYVGLGLLRPDYSLEGFLYDPNPRPDYSWLYVLAGLLGGVLVVGGLAWAWNGQLRDAVAHRTRELHQSERQVNLLLNSTEEAIYGLDLNGDCTFCNPASLRLLGYDRPEQLLGRNMHDLIHHTRPDGLPYPKEECRVYEVYRCGQGTHVNDELLWRANGTSFPAEYWAHPVRREPGGEVMGAVVTFLDITDRRQVEEERVELIARLEAQNIELERYAYTVSHDLKAPLITLQGYMGALKEDLADGNGDAIEEDLARMSGAANKMGRLLEELLELSRIGRVVHPSVEIPLQALVDEAIELTQGQIAARQVDIQVAPNLPVVFGDKGRLLEVLQNLIENAVKYMGDQSRPQIKIGAWTTEEETGCFVQDNGIGVDPEYHEKVFFLFDQLDPAAEGSGIGLALAKRIVEVHGGRMWVESPGAGHGATFQFSLPNAASKNTGA